VTPARTALVIRARGAAAVSSRLEALAAEAGVHPELARRLVALGLLDTAPQPLGPDAALRLARAVRLRRDLGLNYAGALLAGELLDRIEQLELRLRRYEPTHRQER
jgi:hypothetical protein